MFACLILYSVYTKCANIKYLFEKPLQTLSRLCGNRMEITSEDHIPATMTTPLSDDDHDVDNDDDDLER